MSKQRPCHYNVQDAGVLHHYVHKVNVFALHLAELCVSNHLQVPSARAEQNPSLSTVYPQRTFICHGQEVPAELPGKSNHEQNTVSVGLEKVSSPAGFCTPPFPLCTRKVPRGVSNPQSPQLVKPPEDPGVHSTIFVSKHASFEALAASVWLRGRLCRPWPCQAPVTARLAPLRASPLLPGCHPAELLWQWN